MNKIMPTAGEDAISYLLLILNRHCVSVGCFKNCFTSMQSSHEQISYIGLVLLALNCKKEFLAVVHFHLSQTLLSTIAGPRVPSTG